jgi:hypothetical protein
MCYPSTTLVVDVADGGWKQPRLKTNAPERAIRVTALNKGFDRNIKF